MARECNVCKHFYKNEINLRLLNIDKTGESFVSIARDYEGLTESSVRRHYLNHLITTDSSELNLESFDPKLEIKKAEIETWQMYQKALSAGDVQTALKSLDLSIKCTKLADEMGRTNQTVKLEDTAEFQEFIMKLLKVLDKFPEAKQEAAKCFRTN